MIKKLISSITSMQRFSKTKKIYGKMISIKRIIERKFCEISK